MAIGLTVGLVGTTTAAALDAALIWRRFEQVSIEFPAVEDGVETWLLLGSDDRRSSPGEDVGPFGTPVDVPTRSADVLLLYQRDEGGRERLVGLNRDLVLATEPIDGRDAFARLGPELEAGEQAVVDIVCTGLGVAVDHVVVLDLAGLVELVDLAGGVEIDVEAPVRDDNSGLVLEEAGRQRVDGPTALAWIRSRHPQALVDGAWVPGGPTPGERPTRGLDVARQVAADLASDRWPPSLHRAGWAIGPHVTVDAGVGPRDLLDLASRLHGGEVEVVELPVRYGSVDPVPIARLEEPGREVLAELGTGGCEPPG